MSHTRGRKVKDIVLKIGDRNMTVQGVTEKTTCDDVIKMVLRKFNNTNENTHSYFLFECGNGSDRMLSEKTKVLKTMRTWGLDNTRHFSLKAVRKNDKVIKAKSNNARKTHGEFNNLDITSKIENAAKLAFVVKSQKTRIHKHQSRKHVNEKYRDEAETNVGEFISNVNKTKMAGFQNFRGSVTANERLSLSGISDSSRVNERVPSNGFVGAKKIKRVDEINDVKYATKKVLKYKRVSETNGYTNAGMARKHTLIDCDRIPNIPKQSTPTPSAARQNLKRHEALAKDISTKIARAGLRKRKDIILQKYFADYLSYNSPNRQHFSMPKRERGDGAEISFSGGNPDKGDGSFSTGTPMHDNTARARRHSDSDSGQEDHDQEDNLDNAFCKTVTGHFDSTCNYRYAHIKRLPRKLVNYEVTMALQTDKLVDYSFSDSSVLESGEDTVDILERNVFDEDDEMASFMDSKLHDDFSDEGLSSLGSEDEHD